MAGRRCKCRVCQRDLLTSGAYRLSWKGKNVYFCTEPESWDWVEEQKKIEVETEVWNLLYAFVKVDILGYRSEQVLPKYLVERLQDLRNGTVFERGRGRVQRSKNGYPYGVILETFKSKRTDILYWFNNKTFENERQKINYMMAIVESSVNDLFLKWERVEKDNKVAENKLFDIDNKNIAVIETPIKITKENTFAQFLDDEDL